MKYLLLALLLLPVATAIQVQEIYPNPYNEAGSEYILIYNEQPNSINLNDWTIATAASNTDATLIGTVQGESTFLIADNGWNESKDNQSWPDADYTETLTLGNSNGFVTLIDDQGIIADYINYTSTTEGVALRKENGTINEVEPFSFTNIKTGSEIEIEIENVEFVVINITVQDDHSDPGIQIMPISQPVKANVQITIEDNNTLEGIRIYSGENITVLNITSTSTTIEYQGLVQNNSINIQITDGTYEYEQIIPVEVLEIAGIEVSSLSGNAKPGQEITDEIRVENFGSAIIDVQIRGEIPTLAQQVIGNIWYTIGAEEFELDDTLRTHDTNIIPYGILNMPVRIQTGYVPSGLYQGQIIVTGIPQ